jgi:hypothetical protein
VCVWGGGEVRFLGPLKVLVFFFFGLSCFSAHLFLQTSLPVIISIFSTHTFPPSALPSYATYCHIPTPSNATADRGEDEVEDCTDVEGKVEIVRATREPD